MLGTLKISYHLLKLGDFNSANIKVFNFSLKTVNEFSMQINFIQRPYELKKVKMKNSRVLFSCASIFCSKSLHIFTRNINKIQNYKRLCYTNVNTFSDFSSYHVSDSNTIGAMFKMWRHIFEKNSISEPVESIEHILAFQMGTTQIPDVYKNKDKILSKVDVSQINSLCAKRLEHVPIQYILGEWSFRHLTLKMSPSVFIPRPETEQLVDIVLEHISRKSCSHILDLCCGSGAIGLSLLHEQIGLKVTSIDQSEAACMLTKENAQKHELDQRIRVIQSQVEHWQCEEKFSLIVSNPPYIFKKDMNDLQVEIKLYEDLKALDGGDDGLDIIKIILNTACGILQKNGALFLEVDPKHPRLLENYLKHSALGLSLVKTYQDFCKKDRFVKIIKTL